MMPRKTLEMHRLSGTQPQVKPATESTVAGGRAKIPSHLTVAERAAFKKLHKMLEDRRVITPGDELILAQAAVLTVRWQEAMQDVKERGLLVAFTVLTSNGQPIQNFKKNPMLTIAQETEKGLLACLDRLGLVPLSREKVKRAAVKAEPVYREGTLGWFQQQQEKS